MAVTLTVNGTDYSFPQAGDSPPWGANVQSWASAVTSGMLQKAGGTFTLTAEVDFGATFGLKSVYYKSRTSNPSSTGIVRLANDEGIGWRNAANGADKILKVNSSDLLEYDGAALATQTYVTTQVATANQLSELTDVNISTPSSAQILIYDGSDSWDNKSISGDITLGSDGAVAIASGVIVNADVKSDAAIAFSKLAALTASRVLVSDGSGVVSASSVTSTTLGYLDATSSIQTQLDAKFASANVVDEDNMASDSDSKVPTQQSVKAYVDTQVASAAAVDTITSDSPSTDYAIAAADESVHVLTPSAAVDVNLDDDFTAGRTITIVNESTSNTITVKAADDSTIEIVPPSSSNRFLCITSSPADNTDWQALDKPLPTSEFLVHTPTGHGSTGTKIRTWTSANATTVGSDLTYTSDATNGDYVTVNRAGIYATTMVDERTGANNAIGVSINADGTQRTQDINTLPASQVLANTSANSELEGASGIARLNAGDILRCHNEGGTTGTGTYLWWRITQIAIL